MLIATALLLATAPALVPTVGDTTCPVHHPDRMPAAGRKSPLDSLTFKVGDKPVKICYGRPSSRGRTMIGGEHVPYGTIWRTGANEPTVFFTPIALSVAGIDVPAGTYALYTVPGEKEWEIIVNRATSQWGEEHAYTDEVKAQEVGRGKVKSEALKDAIETFTIRADPASGNAKAIVLEWEKTRVAVPVAAR